MADIPQVILVDGSSYLYRAFHALPNLTTSRGQPTGAVRGVISMLRRLAKDYPAALIVVVFDAKGKTFRDEIYPAYKANRPAMPEELRAQIDPINEIIDAMGMPRLVIPGVEADDVIGSLAAQAKTSGQACLISTGDKDMAQLVEPGVELVNTMTDQRLDGEGVRAKFGVEPAQIVDFLALTGDAVDNIPGVPKCGPKTAAKWLTTYGTLEQLMAHADEIGGKVGGNLRESLPQLPMSRELARIRRDIELEQGIGQLVMAAPDLARLQALFKGLEFNRWTEELAEVPGEGADAVTASRPVYEIILTETDFQRWLEKLTAAPVFALDTETTSLDYMEAELVGISFAVAADEAAYLPLAHDYPEAPRQISRDTALKALRPLLESPDKGKIGQNLKYDMSVLARYQVRLQGIQEDTMLESYVVNSTGSRHDMDTLALKLLGYRTVSFEAIAGKGAKQKTFNQIDIDTAGQYAAEDADITLKLHHALFPRLQETPTLMPVYREIELPLVPVLSRIERNGACLDVALLETQSRELGESLAQLKDQVFELAGDSFNLDSPKQLQAILFEKMGLPVLRKTPKGQPSTAEPVLQELALDYPLPRLILEYRSLNKLKTTYTDKLPQLVKPATGRVHTSYHQAVTATGRLSSSDPNLQNIPVRTREGRRIRQAFVAEPGNLLVAADYSQIELRIMAHLSADAGLQAAFAAGQDVHAATAAEVFGTGLESVTADQRRSAKAINFGLIYGMSAFGLARQLGISRFTAERYIETYFNRYPGVQAYMQRIREAAAEEGFVETFYGRRLYLPEINSRNFARRQAAERTAINAPMQGTAADIIKRAMIRVDQWLDRDEVPARMIMQVHDELVLEVAAHEAVSVGDALAELMISAGELSVPLVVDVGIGKNWDEAH